MIQAHPKTNQRGTIQKYKISMLPSPTTKAVPDAEKSAFGSPCKMLKAGLLFSEAIIRVCSVKNSLWLGKYHFV